MLLRHPWLSPLMQPPTEDEAAKGPEDSGAEPEDKEVADWVNERLAVLTSGQEPSPDKPALHAAPLDAVPGSPLLEDAALKQPA